MDQFEQNKQNRRIKKAQYYRAQAQAFHEKSEQAVGGIPMGQPILIGHHSERRHRRAIETSHRNIRKSIDMSEKAEHYEQLAQQSSFDISSDDDNALPKLQAKLQQLEHIQAEMKQVNSEYKKGSRQQVSLLSDDEKQALLRHNIQSGRYFARFQLTNNAATIRRVKLRINQLTAEAARTVSADIEGNGFTVSEHKEDNRVWVTLTEKPQREVCQIMRTYGFKWSPTRCAWVRMLNAAGREAAIDAVRRLVVFYP